MNIARIAQAMACRFLCSIAVAMNEPTPGSVTVVLPTLMASEATTKNHPPDMDIIMFQIKGGMPNGTSRRQNRSHGLSWKLRAASTISSGMLRRE